MLIKKVQNGTVGTRERMGASNLDQLSRLWEAYDVRLLGERR